jgi:hypothetical protein
MAFPGGLPQPIRCFNGVFTFLGVGVHGFDVPSIGGLFQPASPLIGGAAFKGVAVDGGNMTFVGGLLRTKKADVVELPKAFGHVGLLFNEPPYRDRLLFIESSDDHSL